MKYSVIVPTPSVSPEPAVLADLVAIAGVRTDVEILVAVGNNPSRQRNLAVQEAVAETLVFLDSDCRVSPAHFDRLDQQVDAGCRVLGGPVLLHQPAEPNEILFQSLLAHPLLTGKSSARYGVTGVVRPCGDAELILCNMAVNRQLFRDSGGFAEQLYPNEENEWMERIQAAGEICWHDPELAVRRPQRKTWSAYVRMLTGYGRGRTNQFLVSGKFEPVRQAPVVALFVWLVLLIWRPRLALIALGAAWFGGALAARVTARSDGFSPRAAMFAPTVPLLYAVGQILGFLPQKPRSGGKAEEIFRYDPEQNLLRPVK